MHNWPESDWGVRYWENYSQLQTIKRTWDPRNVFNHCHSVGSTDNTCCPDYQVEIIFRNLSPSYFNNAGDWLETSKDLIRMIINCFVYKYKYLHKNE